MQQGNNNNNNIRNNNNSSYVDENGRVIDTMWETRKIMASPTAKQIPENHQFTIDGNGRRIYHTAQGERMTNLRLASAQPMRSEGELLSEAQRIRSEEDLKRLTAIAVASKYRSIALT